MPIQGLACSFSLHTKPWQVTVGFWGFLAELYGASKLILHINNQSNCLFHTPLCIFLANFVVNRSVFKSTNLIGSYNFVLNRSKTNRNLPRFGMQQTCHASTSEDDRYIEWTNFFVVTYWYSYCCLPDGTNCCHIALSCCMHYVHFVVANQ